MTEQKTGGKQEAVGGKRRADGKSAKPARSGKGSGSGSGKGAAALDVDKVRNVAASVVWLLAVVAAAFLAVGALAIALDFNLRNSAVDFVTSTADRLNFLGILKDFEPDGRGADAERSAMVKTALVNWGIAAVVYLLLGKILERLIRP